MDRGEQCCVDRQGRAAAHAVSGRNSAVTVARAVAITIPIAIALAIPIAIALALAIPIAIAIALAIPVTVTVALAISVTRAVAFALLRILDFTKQRERRCSWGDESHLRVDSQRLLVDGALSRFVDHHHHCRKRQRQ